MNPNPITDDVTAESLLREASLLADSYAFDDAQPVDGFPMKELQQLFSLGFCKAPLPMAFGGAGLGTDPGSQLPLLEILRELGRANLSLARVYEGHINAIVLIFAFGTVEQQAEAARACFESKLFSVWNTDGVRPVRLVETSDDEWMLYGDKAFASAAEQAECFLVTADKPDGGRQMCFLHAEECKTAIDKESWRPLGMEDSASFRVSFDGTTVSDLAFIGEVGDYYRAPLFLGGAIRTSAIHLGGAEALLRNLQKYVRAVRRGGDVLSRRRAAIIYTAVNSGRMWIEASARIAEENMHLHATPAQIDQMNFTANATRVAIERMCSDVIQLVIESVGARGLNYPYRFSDTIRDLTMFLRQPDPDGCISEVGRVVLDGLNG